MTKAARLAGRRILITGGASGIGLATVRLFAEEGARLGILDLNEAGLEAVRAETGADVVRCDLSDGDAVDQAVEQIAQRLGGLDGIVNCAGISFAKTLEEADPQSWRLMHAVNLDAPYRVCRAALPYLQAAQGATIVNVSSGQALLPTAPGMLAYASSKAGLIAFTKALAIELAPRIRANVLCPGLVNTPMVESLLAGHDNPNEAPFVQQYALKRPAHPREMAEALLFLTSDASSYVTGTVLAADGGRTFH
jgi:NAD(P)-dependent dehydrogenase (short-subunit alcohol dehydrogenase family)